MDGVTNSIRDAEKSSDLQAIISDVSALKHDLAALVRHMKTDVAENVTDARSAVGQLGEEALRVYGNVAAQGQRSVKAIGRQVEEQPIMSLLLAFAIGVIGSRVLSR
jgi:hypothetical protein